MSRASSKADLPTDVRLEALSVCNWGSFHGLHTIDIDPDGTLITGDNGSGKSTLVDGLMALLLPAGKATFNVAAAQGDRSDRSLLSYVRGVFGSAHDGDRVRLLQKRDGATFSALRARYRTDNDDIITLAALFWITQPSMSLADLNRLYLTARRDLSLEEVLKTFNDGDVRELKRVLKADDAVTCHDSFSAYETVYRRLLRVANPNAPALLSRALGLKKIDDLTRLIRELVLEPSEVQDEARKAVGEFGDLKAIHDKLLDARHQYDTLTPLPTAARDIETAQFNEDRYKRLHQCLPAWFGAQRAQLYHTRIEHLRQSLANADAHLTTLAQATEDMTTRVEQYHGAYLQAGGNQLESLREKLQHAKTRLDETTQRAAAYQQIARRLGLKDTLLVATFNTNQQHIDEALAQQAQHKAAAEQQFADAAVKLSKCREQRESLAQEIAEIETRPDSNIAPDFQKLRDNIRETLDLEPEALVFIGELLDVKADEKNWQGAIERAFGGLRTTLLIPPDRYALVTRWLNQHHTGLFVRAQTAGTASGKMAEFLTDGYLRKLEWKSHPYRDWLKQHLVRFDLRCVDSTEILDNTPFSMTREGLIHKEQGRFEKQDQHRVDNRRYWQLGFSNQTRLALLRQELQEAQAQEQAARKAVDDERSRLDAQQATALDWQRLAEISWDMIDAPRWQTTVRQLQDDLTAHERNAGELAIARQRWEAAKTELADLRRQQDEQKEVVWGLQQQRDLNETARQKAAELAAGAKIDEETRKLIEKSVPALKDADLERAEALERKRRGMALQMIETAQNRLKRATSRAINTMSEFRRGWELIAGEWGANDLNDLDKYQQHFEQLKSEGLPKLVGQFKERLNHHAGQSLANIRTMIDSERENTQDRIGVINTVLARTEFRPGSYLRLRFSEEKFPHVKAFDKQLRTVLGQVDDDNHEARFQRLEEIVATLDKASHPNTANTLESRRLLDTRYRLSFKAEEIRRDDDEVLDVLESSSGKSGGEKESFAGAIVAASLSYVLTPDGADAPVYRTVFLDEAFSNTAETVSRRVMKIFHALNIHINLITPYKNLNIACESARSLIIAERDAAKHESRLCTVTWEELDRQQIQAAVAALPADVEVEQVGV